MAESDGRSGKEYSKSELYLGNLAILLWMGLGAFSCGLFYPLAAVLFFGLAAYLVFYKLGKRGCVTCYYCKSCTIGWGKLPELFFKQTGTANVNRRALRLFPFVYLLLSAFPIALFVVSFFQEIAVYNVVLLVVVLVFSAYTGVVRRQTLLSPSSKRGVVPS